MGGLVSNSSSGIIRGGSNGTGIAIHSLPGTVINAGTVNGGMDI
jgi:hypothetical protein